MDVISIAITDEERAVFIQANPSELAIILLDIAAHVDLKSTRKIPVVRKNYRSSELNSKVTLMCRQLNFSRELPRRSWLGRPP